MVGDTGRRLLMRVEHGFTLMELMIAVAVLAIAAAMAAPSFTSLIKETHTRAQARALVESLELARSAAVTKRNPVSVCASTNGVGCADDAAAWSSGWVVRNTVDGAILHVGTALSGGSTLASAADTLTFNSFGELPASVTLTLTPSGCHGTDARLIDVVTTGLVNVQKAAC